MSFEALQNQFVQFYNGVSAIVAEQTKGIKEDYPILSQVDTRISATVLTLISVCIAPFWTGLGVCAGFLGVGRYPHLRKNIKQIDEVAVIELKFVAAAIATLLFYTYASALLPLGIGIAAGVLLASINEKMTKKNLESSLILEEKQNKAEEVALPKAQPKSHEEEKRAEPAEKKKLAEREEEAAKPQLAEVVDELDLEQLNGRQEVPKVEAELVQAKKGEEPNLAIRVVPQAAPKNAKEKVDAKVPNQKFNEKLNKRVNAPQGNPLQGRIPQLSFPEVPLSDPLNRQLPEENASAEAPKPPVREDSLNPNVPQVAKGQNPKPAKIPNVKKMEPKHPVAPKIVNEIEGSDEEEAKLFGFNYGWIFDFVKLNNQDPVIG